MPSAECRKEASALTTEVDQLEVKVQSDSQSAVSGLEKLEAALGSLKTAAQGGAGLATVARGLEWLNAAMSSLQVNKKGLASLKTSLSGLSGVKTHLTTTANQLKKINEAMANLRVDDAKLNSLVSTLTSLNSIEKPTGLTSTIATLKQIPAVTKALSSSELQKFGLQIKLLVKYLAPLADQMEKVASGFASLPANIKKAIDETEKASKSNDRAAQSFSLLESPIVKTAGKLLLYAKSARAAVDFLADCVTSINEYVENVNLFQVAMGDYYNEAFAYAQLVSEKLGVDPSAWMRTQGVFQSIANGFGMAEEQAYALSEGLTELSYDLSSLYNEDIESSALRLQSALAGEIEPIRRLGISITEATLKEFALSNGIKKSVESMTEQEKALLRSMKLIEGAANIGAVGDFARTLESPANALRVLNQQITQMKRALGSVLLPALVQIIPYVQAFVSLITDALSALAQFVGFTMPQWNASSWNSSVSSVSDALDSAMAGASGVSDAMDDATESAKDLKNATLGIDELNVISPESGGSSGSGSGGAGGSNWAAGVEIPDIWDKNALANITSKVDELKTQIAAALSKITAVVSGFQLAVGAFLVVTGVNIPLGIGLMAAGAAGLAATVALNWGTMDASVRGVLTSITAMVSGAMLALGIMLILGQQYPLGIGCLAVGAVSLVTSVALNWGGVSSQISATLTTITSIVGGALLAVGAILVFSGAFVSLGIGLLIAGAATLGTAVALNWTATNTELKNTIEEISANVSLALLVLGAIFTFSGANPALGIGLMVAGALTLGTMIALDWDSMTPKVKNAITSVTTLVGTAFLALGAMLTFSGANIPMGIGFMVAGAVGLVTAAALNWDAVVTAVTTTLKEVGHIVGISLIAIGAILLLTGVGAPLGLGMIIAGGVALAASVALNWDSIVTSVTTTLKNIGSKFLDFVDEWLSPSKWLELGKNAIDGLFKGLSDIWGNVTAWGEGLLADVKNVLGIHSPSVEFEEIGDYATEGFLRGFFNTEAVVETMGDILENVKALAASFSTDLASIIGGSLDVFHLAVASAVDVNEQGISDIIAGYQVMAVESNNAINSIISNLNAIPRNITTVHTIITKTSGGAVSSDSQVDVPGYAAGGFPEYGQLFIANEDAPELVGTIGRQTAVANSQQIVQGIAAGVEEANMQQNALLREQNELLRAILEKQGATYLDGKILLRSMEKASRNTGVNIMSGGVV